MPFKKINLKIWAVLIASLLVCPYFLYARDIVSDQEKLILEFIEGLNIPDGDTLRLIYTGSGSDPSALLRDTSGNPSYWGGTFWSNYSVLFINPNGITFGANANIQVASFIASTLNISNSDFLSGNLNFKKIEGLANAQILNRGRIVVNGGYVALLAGAVQNQGTIIAQLGTVVLASGEEMTLALDDLNQISVVIDEAVKSEIIGLDGKRVDSAIKNSGNITADGGKVILTAKVLNNVFDYAINNTGIIQAKSLVNHNGSIELIAEGAPIINTGSLIAGSIRVDALTTNFINKGKVSADGYEGLPNGGRVSIEAANVLQQGLISANAYEGGIAGEVNIVSHESTVLDEGSRTEARALGNVGYGGRVLLNGGKTLVNKNAVIDVSAGAISGDAGYIEVGAFEQLGFYGILNGRAPPGFANAKIIFKNNPTQSQPATNTDEADYPSEGTPVVSGRGFRPNTEIVITITAPDGTSTALITYTDSEGNFTLTYQPLFLVSGLYVATASDGLKSAVTTFTDTPKVGSLGAGVQSPSPVNQGDSATYTVTINRGAGPGSAGAFDADLSISGLPAGASATFSSSTVHFYAGDNSKTVTLTITTSGSTPVGDKTFTVKAQRTAGDYAEGSGTLSVAAGDTTAPAGSINANSGNPYTNTSTITLNLSGTDDTGITGYRIADGNDASGATEVLVPSDTPFSKDVSWTLPAGDGAKNVTVQYRDAAGNWSPNYTATINLDTTAPAAPSTPDLDAADDSGTSAIDNITNNTASLTLNGTAEANSVVEIFVDGISQGTTNADGAGNWTKDIGLLEGSYTITAKAQDAAGNTSGASGGLSLTIDTTAPAIAITSPANGITSNTLQTLLYTVSDNLDPAPAIGGAASGSVYSAVGTYLVLITAKDLAGNTNSGSVSFTITSTSYADSQLSNASVIRLILPDSQQSGVFQFNFFIPGGPAYLYHPLTPIDMSAFQEFILREGAYEFIDGAINIVGHERLLPFLR